MINRNVVGFASPLQGRVINSAARAPATAILNTNETSLPLGWRALARWRHLATRGSDWALMGPDERAHRSAAQVDKFD